MSPLNLRPLQLGEEEGKLSNLQQQLDEREDGCADEAAGV